ncbi:MAG: pyridoxal 5'-phosphate synthase glutaminase subunit PdxT [Anaerolineae bacterium]|nr:pyridoxal 5'-phosphate synthase glutaminase subunit PdxT [Anaerolineae bacterium]
MLRGLGVEGTEVRLPGQLKELDGLIIPGGESTAIGKLAVSYGLLEPLRQMGRKGWPIWGTCAGMIMLASDIGGDQPLLGLMDISVQRNAFGRQVDSFEMDLSVPALASIEPESQLVAFRAVFIRAPLIQRVGSGVEILARLDDDAIVAAREGNLLATAFHPELGSDVRFHKYFLAMVRER